MHVGYAAMQENDIADAVALWAASEGVELCEGDDLAGLARYLARNPGFSQVARADGKLVGAALCGHDGRRGVIYHLAVARGSRRFGVGRELLHRCESALRAAGLGRAIILVARDNGGASAFWRRAGWEPLDGAQAFSKGLSAT